MKIGDRVIVTVGAETHRGAITGRRHTTYSPVVSVEFWHQGRREEIEYFESDGALRTEDAS